MSEKPQKFSVEIPVVIAAGIRKSFGEKTVLEGINLQLKAGEGLCVVGANAVGKTTLLKIIAGLLQPDSGIVNICGLNAAADFCRVKPIIGAIFHKSMIYSQLSVEENLRFFAGLYGVSNIDARIEEILGEAGLTHCRSERAGILSYGMVQRLAIARALVHRPAVLLADEPFTGLDSEAAKHLIEILCGFKDGGGGILMTTHNVDSALQCCERIAVLDNKKIIFSTRVSEINADEFGRDYVLYARKNS